MILDYGHHVRVVVSRTLTVGESPDKLAARVPEIIAAANKWMKDRDPQTLSMFGVALAVTAILEEEFPGRWVASIAGGEEPADVSLSGPSSTSVRVFPGKVIVTAADKVHDLLMIKRENVVDNRARLVEAVRAQIACYEHHAVTNARLHAVAQPLANRLAAALKLPAKVSFQGEVTHQGCEQASIAFGAHRVVIAYRDGDLRVHAGPRVGSPANPAPGSLCGPGLTGSTGYDATLEAMDEALVVEALRFAHRSLTINGLTPRARYRVLESVGPLVKGTVVTFVGLNDIDNHYGELDFELDGKPISIGGDYSSPDHTMLGETHRYLAAVD